MFFFLIVRFSRRKEAEKWENGSASKTWKSNAGSSAAVWSQRPWAASAAGQLQKPESRAGSRGAAPVAGIEEAIGAHSKPHMAWEDART